MSDTHVVVLAAGQGTRMKSGLPKVLHEVAGRPLIEHVLKTASSIKPTTVNVVVGHMANDVRGRLASHDLQFAVQEPQLGTAHALQQAEPLLAGQTGTLVLLSGDVPLLTARTLGRLIETHRGAKAAATVVTATVDRPYGYGRIVRSDGRIVRIVEERDASPAERQIKEINSGIYAFDLAPLFEALRSIASQNAQGEFYLTDIVAMAVADGVPVVAHTVSDEVSILGINDRAQLASLERIVQRRKAATLMLAGTAIVDPNRIDIRGELVCGRDVTIDVGCVFEGRVAIEEGASVGAYCVLRDTTIGAGTRVEPFSHFDSAIVGANCRIGPYARLRPGTNLAEEVHIGNFVEVKASTLGARSKANHLAYIGDATVGSGVNYGAGSITANYDGANKHRSIIGDDVHVGSNCVLVAPITVGAGATIGGGSTIVKEAPAGQLTVARAQQVSIERWRRPRKKVQDG